MFCDTQSCFVCPVYTALCLVEMLLEMLHQLRCARMAVPLLLLLFYCLLMVQDPSYRVLPAVTLGFTWSTADVFRIKLEYFGYCVGVANGTEVGVVWCDPLVDHSFSFTFDGKLMATKSMSCVRQGEGALSVGPCQEEPSLHFDVQNTTYLKVKDLDLCVSLETANGTRSVYLRPCTDPRSRVHLTTESQFQQERRYLKLPPLPNTTHCDFAACPINRPLEPVRLLPPGDVTRCRVMAECVTIVIKTARRPRLVTRLARSFREVMGYDVPVIAVDDGVGPYDNETMSEIANITNLRYLITDTPDLGIAEGRTLGVNQVTTKYFLLLDDDTLFHTESNIELLVEILDTTDASLVGGKVAYNKPFAGFLVFKRNPRSYRRDLVHFSGACRAANLTIPNFPTCTNCDVTTNVFIAKTQDVLEVGGWTPELKVKEHKDLFVRLKAGGKKVVYCPSFSILNRKPNINNAYYNTVDISKLKLARSGQMEKRMENFWNVDSIHKSGAKAFFNEVRSFPREYRDYYNRTSKII